MDPQKLAHTNDFAATRDVGGHPGAVRAVGRAAEVVASSTLPAGPFAGIIGSPAVPPSVYLPQTGGIAQTGATRDWGCSYRGAEVRFRNAAAPATRKEGPGRC